MSYGEHTVRAWEAGEAPAEFVQNYVQRKARAHVRLYAQVPAEPSGGLHSPRTPVRCDCGGASFVPIEADAGGSGAPAYGCEACGRVCASSGCEVEPIA